MRKVIVTGGAGFIGSNIVDRLIESGEYEITVIDNFATGKKENIEHFLDKVNFIECDINDDKVMEITKDTDTIIHQAAIPSVPRSVENPFATHTANLTGTVKLLTAARDNKVRRFIFASSSSVYGDSPVMPKKEDMFPAPLSPYAVSKLACEYYCKVFFELYGVETVCLRYFNIFGPRQDPNSQYSAAIPKFITMILNNIPPTIFGDGEQTRDFTYVGNVVNANILAIDAASAPGKIINIACSDSVTVNKLVNLLFKYLNKQGKPEYLPARQGDVKHSLADISMANKILGYEPSVDIEEGLSSLCEYFLKEI